MTLTELKVGLIALLQSRYPTKKYNYYSMAVVEKYDRPCFFTQILPVDMSPANFNSRKNRALFYITFMQEKTDETEMLEIIQGIRDLLGLSVQIKERAVKVVDFDWNYTGTYRNIPEISVELEWFDRIEHKNDAPLMEQVITKKKWR